MLNYWKKLKIGSDSVGVRSNQQEGKEGMGGKDTSCSCSGTDCANTPSKPCSPPLVNEMFSEA